MFSSEGIDREELSHLANCPLRSFFLRLVANVGC